MTAKTGVLQFSLRWRSYRKGYSMLVPIGSLDSILTRILNKAVVICLIYLSLFVVLSVPISVSLLLTPGISQIFGPQAPFSVNTLGDARAHVSVGGEAEWWYKYSVYSRVSVNYRTACSLQDITGHYRWQDCRINCKLHVVLDVPSICLVDWYVHMRYLGFFKIHQRFG